jgi:hypothetical protein
LTRPDIDAAILAAVTARGAGKSICPSEVARAITPASEDWRHAMHPVREAARNLARAGRIAILRKGRVVDPDDFKGVIRLSLPRTET